MTIMQGDSYPIHFELTIDGTALKPEMIEELEVSLGKAEENADALRKLYSKGEVLFDENENRWYFHPTQEETLALSEGYYRAVARPRYKNSGKEEVIGVTIGQIKVERGNSKAVI